MLPRIPRRSLFVFALGVTILFAWTAFVVSTYLDSKNPGSKRVQFLLGLG